MNYPLKDLKANFTEYKGKRFGLMFTCPNCGTYGSVTFRPVPDGFESHPSWEANGESIETLSLFPSVERTGHFHSWIKSGELQVDSPFYCKAEA